MAAPIPETTTGPEAVKGTKIAFEREYANPSTEVLIMNADGTGRTPSASSTLDAVSPGWGIAPIMAPVPAAERCTIGGTRGRDVLRGTNGDDVICGGRGNDVPRGGDDSDNLLGEDGRDVLHAKDRVGGNDVLDGSKHRDACHADRGDEKSGCR